MKKVSVIIPNFNGEGYLATCLSSLLKSSYKDFEVILVDDGSVDGSLEIIQKFLKKDKRLKLVRNKKNLGAAASRNKAIKVAKGEILVFLDNDTEVDRDWLGELVKPLFGDKSIGAAQSLILDFEKRNLIQMAGGLLMPQTGWLLPFYQWEKYQKVKNKLREREIVAISASLAVRKEVFEKIGGFDEKEAVYTEDLDFCWRVWVAGYKIVLAPKSIVYHFTKPVEKRFHMGGTYEKIYFHLAKNSFRSIIKNYEFRNLVKYLPVSVFVNLGRGFLVLMKRGSFSALKGTMKAIFWNARFLSDTLAKRKDLREERVFSDSEIMRRCFLQKSLIKIYDRYFRGSKLLW
jgi:hypothetical protein